MSLHENSYMVAESKLPFNVTRPEPLIWVSRVVLLESTDPEKRIRDIALHRGLNIVWATEKDDEPGGTPLVAGHGVGKTTFCRLVRYCLGEQAFGNQRLVKRIREAFPQGAIGAHIHVGGTRWAVLRPLGTTYISYALENGTIEDVLANRPGRNSYRLFRENLERVVRTTFFNGNDPSSSPAVPWDHMLALCSRDQETRYQHLWEWRSARSESGTPAFKKPKTDAMQSLRTVLGLLLEAEVAAQQRLAEIERELGELDHRIAERRREPEYWTRHLRAQLRQRFQIDQADTAPLEADQLFSLPKLVGNRQEEVNRRIQEFNEALRLLDRQIALVAARVSEAEQFAEAQGAGADVTQAGSDALAVSADELEDRRNLIDQNRTNFCRYGGVTIEDCQHVQAHLIQLDAGIRQARTQAAGEVGARDQAAAAMREVAGRGAATVQRIRQQLDELQQQRRGIQSQRDSLERDARGLAETLTDLIQWDRLLHGGAADPTMAQLDSQRLALTTEQARLNEQIRQSVAGHRRKLEEVRGWFDYLVHEVLPGGYVGGVRLQDGEVLYDIAHGNLLAGEAVETLTLLLADVSWLLTAASGLCRHPGFLVHDSPREADLGARIYRHFLQCIGALHSRLGGQTSAPFQYIVTTTTPPPVELQGEEYVRLSLSNELTGFLFQRDLGAPSELVTAPTLFEDQGGESGASQD